MGRQEMKTCVEDVMCWIDENFNQYNMPDLHTPYRFNERCAVFFNGIGGVILYEEWFRTFSEDDGHFFINTSQGIDMNVAWIEEWEKTFKEVGEYLEKEGKPFYYSGTNTICGYKLG